MSNPIVRVRLTAPWGGCEAGQVLDVDAARAAYLFAESLAESESETTDAPTPRPRRPRVKKSEPQEGEEE